MLRILYSLIFYLAVPLLLLRLLYRSIKAPAYRQRWSERFGFFHIPDVLRDNKQKTIWIHSVSVGETLAAIPLIKSLLLENPNNPIVVTTTTPTGSARVKALLGDSVFHTYFPYDLPGSIRRFIRRANPCALIILETEMWPNTLYHCRRSGIKTLLVNARLSDKSARGYKRIGPLAREMVNNLDCIAAQGQTDGERFIELGANADRVTVLGSLKFDVEVPDQSQTQLPGIFQQVKDSGRQVMVAASTREGEEEKVLAAFKQCLEKIPNLLLVLVPRHPERFQSTAELCESMSLACVRRSSNNAPGPDHLVLVGDSMGEMWLYYSLADIAFVGGSLVNTGCHNVLEPASMGIPVIAGPSQFNFEQICAQLENAGALITVTDENELADIAVQLLSDSEKRRSMGEAGKRCVESNKGSLEKLSKLILKEIRGIA